MPTSTDEASPESGVAGVTFEPQIEHGHETLTGTPADAASRLPLSSMARERMVTDGAPCATQV